MRIGVILPNTNLYGGVKRFYELGSVFLKLGHEFIIFTPEGIPSSWYKGHIETVTLSQISAYPLDALFITEIRFLEDLLKADVRRRIFYFVRASDDIRILKKHPEVEVFANSTNVLEIARRKYKLEAFEAFGGINTKSYYSKELKPKQAGEPYIIMCFGRLAEKKKGTMLVVKACEQLYKKGYNLKLLLFDTPVNERAKAKIDNFKTKVPYEFVLNHPVEKNVELYHKADIFVAAEKKAGYSNTGAEAMASGIPLIATSSGTRDFLIHNETGIVVSRWSCKIRKAIVYLIEHPGVLQNLAKNGRKKIEEFDWEALANRIIAHI